MASLEDTFRIMKGDEPVNKNRLTNEDKNFNETKTKFKSIGEDSSKITRNFMDCVTGTLIENRGGVRPQPKDIEETRADLVDNAKVLTALLTSIKEDRLDERILMNVSRDIKSLTEHLSAYPEFENIINTRIK